MRRGLTAGWVWGSAIGLAALLFVACGGGGSSATAPVAGTTAPPTVAIADAKLRAADFVNINSMTRVGDHFVGNVRGHLAAALAVARSRNGGRYPVGTILQLIPQEAMVKRAPGFSPATNDWEFFSLDASCHSAAQPQYDFVCGTTHGCAPLPIGPAIVTALQQSDPRPRR